jgi:S-formylglutathione hydrolase FrmB
MELEIQITVGDDLGCKPIDLGSGLQIPNSGDYTDRDGGHSWTYWENALPYHMLFFANSLQK